jgi:phospholipase B1
MKLFFLALALLSCTDARFTSEQVSKILKFSELYESKDLLLWPTPNNRFKCQRTIYKDPRPASVHMLRPSDIEVIGSVGDSITAGTAAGAKTLFGLLIEYRGVSWSIGGQNGNINESITIPNILRQFNPNLYGYSTGSTLFGVDSPDAVFNAANPGDTSYDMYPQAVDLVDRMRRSDKINFENSWKIVTLFIGGNDLCGSCNKGDKFSPANYIGNIQKALDYFKANLPRTLINLVLTLNVVGIDYLSGITCRNMQETFCKCGLDENYRPTIEGLAAAYQSGIEDLISSGRYDDTADFTVVVQPLMKYTVPPLQPNGEADRSFWAPDCFHFSTKGHEAAAVELWNSMLTPVGSKQTKWSNMDQDIKCPTKEQPYIFTNRNSYVGRKSLKSLLRRDLN